MRLFLDEMFSPRIAEELTDRGRDVIAVAAQPNLVGTTDDQLLNLATAGERTLVTENVRDFEILRVRWVKEGRTCAGLLYTSRQRFPRDRKWVGRIPGRGEVDWLT